MIVFSNAKINLGLRVKEKRPDKYHNIETIFYPLPLFDIIEFLESDHDELIETGFSTNCHYADNLIFKTLVLFRKHADIPFFRIHLHKQIPVGAGLGGGSGNAAATMLFLNSYLSLGFDSVSLTNFALALGSDVPFFLHNRPSKAYGRGEILEFLDFSLKGYWIFVVFTGLFVSTGAAFNQIQEKKAKPNWQNLSNYCFDSVNDFEGYIFKQYPEIEHIKNNLLLAGADVAALSGSGSSVFGIFNQKPKVSIIENCYFCRLFFISF